MATSSKSDVLMTFGFDGKDVKAGANAMLKELKSISTQTKLLFGAELLRGLNVGLDLAKAGIGKVGDFAKSSVNEFRSGEKSLRRFKAALQGIGVDYKTVEKQVDKVTSAWQRATGVDDEKQKESLATLINYTRNYSDAMNALPIAMDLAAKTGMDLNSASMLIGKGLTGNTKMLERYGIKLSETKDKQKIFSQMVNQISGGRKGSLAIENNSADTWDMIANEVSDIKQDFGKIIWDALLPGSEKLLEVLKSIKDVGLVNFLTDKKTWDKVALTFDLAMSEVIFGDIGKGLMGVMKNAGMLFGSYVKFAVQYAASTLSKFGGQAAAGVGGMWETGRLSDKSFLAKLALQNAGYTDEYIANIEKNPQKYAYKRKGNDSQVVDYAESLMALKRANLTDPGYSAIGKESERSIDKAFETLQKEQTDTLTKIVDKLKQMENGFKSVGEKVSAVWTAGESPADIERRRHSLGNYVYNQLEDAKRKQGINDRYMAAQNKYYGNGTGTPMSAVQAADIQESKRAANEAKNFWKKQEMKRDSAIAR